MKWKKNEFIHGRELPKCLCHYFMLYTSHAVGYCWPGYEVVFVGCKHSVMAWKEDVNLKN